MPIDSRITSFLLWMPLMALSAPVILDWAEHALSRSWAAYSLFFPFAAWRSARAATKRPGSPYAAFALILVGVMIQLWAIAGGSVRYGRPGLLICLTGMLFLLGQAHWRVLVLLALSIPMPYAILKPIGLAIAPALAEFYALLARLTGKPSFASGGLLELPDGTFYLDGTDLGLSSALLAFGMSWLLDTTRGLRFQESFIRGAIAGTGGMLIHVIVTGALIATSEPDHFHAQRTLRDFVVYGVLGVGCISLGLLQCPKCRAQSHSKVRG